MDIETFSNNLEAACTEAARLCRDGKYGRYGGLYVARIEGKADDFEVLPDDDPESDCAKDRNLYAQVDELTTYAIGHARRYLDSNGCVDREYFRGTP